MMLTLTLTRAANGGWVVSDPAVPDTKPPLGAYTNTADLMAGLTEMLGAPAAPGEGELNLQAGEV